MDGMSALRGVPRREVHTRNPRNAAETLKGGVPRCSPHTQRAHTRNCSIGVIPRGHRYTKVHKVHTQETSR
jgi:hypothetical protein